MTDIDFGDLADRLNRVRYKVAVCESAVRDSELHDSDDARNGLAFLFIDIKQELRAMSGIVHEPACDQQSKEAAS